MKRFFSIALILLWTHTLFSQSQGKNPPPHLDGGAVGILDSISKKYKNYKTIKIDYTYKLEKEGKLVESFKGNMMIKGNKYYLLFDKQEYYCNGTTIWNYQKEVNEISIFEYEENSDLFLNPTKLLDNWKKKFRAKFIREEVEKDKNIIFIDITPIKEDSFYKIRIFVDKAKMEIIRFAVYEKDNTIYTYSFDKFLVNNEIDDKRFELNTSAYPNAEINDMR
jgi:outer membrane lipoprotein-sorting protein